MRLLWWAKGRGLLMMAVCALSFWGCSAKVIPLQPLLAGQEVEAERVLHRYLEQPPPEALDADVHLSWDIFGSKGSIDGVLQLQRPASLRLTVLDPLGRALLIVVADDKTFTMIDSRSGRAFQGKVASTTWRRYVPALIEPEDLFYLLGGFVSGAENYLFTGSGRAENNEEFWYVFSDTSGAKEQRLLLDRNGEHLKQRLLIDSDRRPAIDILYSDYLPVAPGIGQWPGRVAITGDSFRGKFRLEVQQLMSVSPLPPGTFYLSIPRHYTVENLP